MTRLANNNKQNSYNISFRYYQPEKRFYKAARGQILQTIVKLLDEAAFSQTSEFSCQNTGRPTIVLQIPFH